VQIVRTAFRQAAEDEILPASIWHALCAVRPLQRGRGQAKDNPPIRAVAPDHVQCVLERLSRHVRAMVEVQMLTGMRPGEVVILRGADLDTSGRVWIYWPSHHKNEHRGH